MLCRQDFPVSIKKRAHRTLFRNEQEHQTASPMNKLNTIVGEVTSATERMKTALAYAEGADESLRWRRSTHRLGQNPEETAKHTAFSLRKSLKALHESGKMIEAVLAKLEPDKFGEEALADKTWEAIHLLESATAKDDLANLTPEALRTLLGSVYDILVEGTKR